MALPSIHDYHVAIPDYHVALQQLMEAEQPALWRWFVQSLQTSTQDAAEAELEILKSAYRLDGDGHAALAGIAHVLAGKLGLAGDVILYQALTDPGSGRRNAGVTMLGSTAHVVFAGDLLSLLDLHEQEAVLAHELAHVWLFQHDGGAFRVLDHLMHRLAVESDAPVVAETARRLRLHTEVFADRFAMSLVSTSTVGEWSAPAQDLPPLQPSVTSTAAPAAVPPSSSAPPASAPPADVTLGTLNGSDTYPTESTPAADTNGPPSPAPAPPTAATARDTAATTAPVDDDDSTAPSATNRADPSQSDPRPTNPPVADTPADTLATVVRALVKLHAGLHHVDAAAYLRQAREILEADSSASSGWTHPELHVRIACLAAREADGGGDIARHLIDGRDDLDRLDLLGQRRLEQLTARVLAGVLPVAHALPDAPSDTIDLHVALFDANFQSPGGRGGKGGSAEPVDSPLPREPGRDTERLPQSHESSQSERSDRSTESAGSREASPLDDDELADAAPSVRHYAAALVLDFAMLMRGDDADLADLARLTSEAHRIGVAKEFDTLLTRAAATTGARTSATSAGATPGPGR